MKRDIDLVIGNRIRAIRVSSSLSAIDIATRTGLPLKDYVRGEERKRRFQSRELFAVAQALGVSMTDLVSDL